MLFNSKGVLGINARNLLYIGPYNKKKSIEMADDKVKTKAFLSARNIPVPKLLTVIKNNKELSKFNYNYLPNEFIIKPNQGFGGGGIIPIIGRKKEIFLGTDDQEYSLEEILEHFYNIISGNYSLTGQKDQVLIEKLIISDDILNQFSYKGLPDIRIIVHNLVPIMAMLRIPTKESNGKANLHQGAIGAGIDMAKGEITHAIHHNQTIKEIMGFGPIKGIKIPFWDEILQIASKAQLATNLGYMGADIAIDKHQGPVLLEINARAGLGIQLANMAPLKKRLEKVAETQVTTIAKGVRLAKDLFGHTVEKNIKSITGKKVIGLYETVDILHQKQVFPTIAYINTTRKKNYISIDLAKKLGLIKSKRQKDIYQTHFQLKFKLAGKKFISIFQIEKNIKKKYQIILGRKDLSGQFLVDTSINNVLAENSQGKSNLFIANYNPIETDRKICKIAGHLKFLSYFRPLNFKQEIEKFNINHSYNPQFTYQFNTEITENLQRDLQKIRYDSSNLGVLFQRKIEELNNYLNLINARGSSDLTFLSKSFLGFPNEEEIEDINQNIKDNPKTKPIKQQEISSEQLKEIFEKKLNEYEIYNWKIVIKEKMIAKCIVSKTKKVSIKANSYFSEQRVKDLIIHELETHLISSENGRKQKYQLFNYGFANYLPTQEGLAVYNVLSQSQDKDEANYKGIIAKAIYLADKHSFAELYEILKQLKLTDKSALDICLRVKRGIGDTSKPGVFTKDYCYYSGLKKVTQFINNGGNLIDLYHGKYSIDDISLIKNISSFTTPPIIPKWLQN